MPDFRLVPINSEGLIAMDLAQTVTGQIEETQSLVTAIYIALLSDALAAPEDELPDFNSDDRRGWWADLDAAAIWGGWPIGSRLWLLERGKIVDFGAAEGATTTRIENYIAECMQPFIDNKLFSSVQVAATQTGPSRIDAALTIYRGPLPAISLQFQALWGELAQNIGT